MSLLQKYRKDETRKTTPEEEKGIKPEVKTPEKKPVKKPEKKPLPPKESSPKRTRNSILKTQGARSRPVISATVDSDLVEALNALTDEKYLNRSKFIEDALKRTIKTEFPEIANRFGF